MGYWSIFNTILQVIVTIEDTVCNHLRLSSNSYKFNFLDWSFLEFYLKNLTYLCIRNKSFHKEKTKKTDLKDRLNQPGYIPVQFVLKHLVDSVISTSTKNPVFLIYLTTLPSICRSLFYMYSLQDFTELSFLQNQTCFSKYVKLINNHLHQINSNSNW